MGSLKDPSILSPSDNYINYSWRNFGHSPDNLTLNDITGKLGAYGRVDEATIAIMWELEANNSGRRFPILHQGNTQIMASLLQSRVSCEWFLLLFEKGFGAMQCSRCNQQMVQLNCLNLRLIFQNASQERTLRLQKNLAVEFHPVSIRIRVNQNCVHD